MAEFIFGRAGEPAKGSISVHHESGEMAKAANYPVAIHCRIEREDVNPSKIFLTRDEALELCADMLSRLVGRNS